MTTASSSKSGGLLKWKGVVFSQDNDDEDADHDTINDDLDSITKVTSNHPSTSSLSSSMDLKNKKQPWRRNAPEDEDEIDLDQVDDDDDDEDEIDGHDIERSSSSSNNRGNPKPLPQRRSPDGREFRDCDMEVSNSSTQYNGEHVCLLEMTSYIYTHFSTTYLL